MALAIASGAASHAEVERSTSVSMNVTVPVGRRNGSASCSSETIAGTSMARRWLIASHDRERVDLDDEVFPPERGGADERRRRNREVLAEDLERRGHQ